MLFALGIQEWATLPAAEARANIQMAAHSNLCIPHRFIFQLPAVRGMKAAMLILDAGWITSSP
jgi:hypothetical protein